jgi:hypothetical protein
MKRTFKTSKVKSILLVFSMLCVVTFTARSQNLAMNSRGNGQPMYKWVTDTVMNLGKVELSKAQVVTFEFVNTGKAPLLITKVQPSCGCTAVEFSKDPINSGEKGFVKTTYNAASPGVFYKTLTVFSNTPNYSTLLAIKGEVMGKQN